MSKMIDKYVLTNSVGQGQYGKVYQAYNKLTNEVVAVKVIKLHRFKQVPKLTQFTINEVNTLKKIDNPNVIQFIEMISSQNNLYLVYQFCNGGNLEEYIAKKRYLSEPEALNMFLQLLHAFDSLVKENIIHRDLKPSNILLHNEVIKVADFGFCKSLEQGDLTQTMVGSPIYMAPEVLLGQPYSLEADIWSLGVCLFEMLFGRCPYEDITIPKLMYQIQNTQLLIPRDINPVSDGVERLLRQMLTVNPQYRIKWHELFQLRPQRQIPRSPTPKSNRSVSPIRQTSSPYQQVFQRKNSQVKMTTSSRTDVDGNYMINNLKVILAMRKRIHSKLNLVMGLLEVNESTHAPIIAKYLTWTIGSDLKLEGDRFTRWYDFKSSPFFEKCSQLCNEDQKYTLHILSQLQQLQRVFGQEARKLNIMEINYEQFIRSAKLYMKQIIDDSTYLGQIRELLRAMKSLGFQVSDPSMMNANQLHQLILQL